MKCASEIWPLIRRWCVVARLFLPAACSHPARPPPTVTRAAPAGQVLTASQAARLAARPANGECQRFHQRQPFSPEQYRAVLKEDEYRWGRLDVGGPQGFSAFVTFAADGRNPEVEAYYFTDIHPRPRSSTPSANANRPMSRTPQGDKYGSHPQS